MTIHSWGAGGCTPQRWVPMAPLAALRCPPSSQSAIGAPSRCHSRPGRLPLGDLVSAPRPFPARTIPFTAVSSSRRPSRLASLPTSHPGPSSLYLPDAFSLGPSPPACCVNDQLGLALALSDPANRPTPYRPNIPAAGATCSRGRAGPLGHRHQLPRTASSAPIGRDRQYTSKLSSRSRIHFYLSP